MITNPITRGIENTFDTSGGLVWNRLHSERENICEALLNEPARSFADARPAYAREALQSRLRKVDDALDRLFSGSYGSCSKCGKQIEDVRLELDAAAGFCKECEKASQDQNSPSSTAALEGVALDTLNPFDTIWVSTHNSDYRILLLDPQTGRVLIEGGQYFVEPIEAMISGSSFGNWLVNNKWIGIGMRIEVWFDDKFIITSAVRAIRVEPHSPYQFELESAIQSYS